MKSDGQQPQTGSGESLAQAVDRVMDEAGDWQRIVCLDGEKSITNPACRV